MSNVTSALGVLATNLTPLEAGGRATSLSALNYNNSGGTPYWRGSNVAGYKRFSTYNSNPWRRFFGELWEVPVKNLIGETSTGAVYIYPAGAESDGENNINNSKRYIRSIPVDVIGVWLDEGTSSQYEDLIDAMLKDALQDPTLGNYITFLRWKAVEPLNPSGIGVVGCRLSLLMDYSVAVP